MINHLHTVSVTLDNDATVAIDRCLIGHNLPATACLVVNLVHNGLKGNGTVLFSDGTRIKVTVKKGQSHTRTLNGPTYVGELPKFYPDADGQLQGETNVFFTVDVLNFYVEVYLHLDFATGFSLPYFLDRMIKGLSYKQPLEQLGKQLLEIQIPWLLDEDVLETSKAIDATPTSTIQQFVDRKQAMKDYVNQLVEKHGRYQTLVQNTQLTWDLGTDWAKGNWYLLTDAQLIKRFGIKYMEKKQLQTAFTAWNSLVSDRKYKSMSQWDNTNYIRSVHLRQQMEDAIRVRGLIDNQMDYLSALQVAQQGGKILGQALAATKLKPTIAGEILLD